MTVLSNQPSPATNYQASNFQSSGVPQQAPAFVPEQVTGYDGGNGGNNRPPTPATTSPEPEPQQPAYDPQFAAHFQAAFGMDIDTAKRTFSDLQQFQAQREVERQESVLRDAWGVPQSEFQYRMSAVRDAWNSMPEGDKQRILYRTGFDEIGAASVVWSMLEAQQMAQPQEQVRVQLPQQQAVPQLERNTSPARQNSQSYDFRASDIQRMSDAEYSANANAIAQAYATGRVLRDI